MKSTLLSCAAVLLAGDAIRTDYTQKRSLRVEMSSSMSLEAKSMRVERNGEPMEVNSSMSTSNSRTVSYVDTTLEHADGAPTKVRRAFEDLANESSTTSGERQMESAMKPRLAGVTLELTRAEDEVEVKLVEGDAEDGALEGHSLELVLDAFLGEGDSWELDNAAIQRGLALDVQNSLFAPPEAEGGEGGGRRGPRGGGPGNGVLSSAELEGKATRLEETEEYGGVECVVIRLEIEGDGDLPEPQMGGGRRGGMFAPAQPLVLLENTYEIELEGRLLYDPAKKMPVRLELEGSVELAQSSERTFNDTTMKIESVLGGELEFEVTISEVDE